MTATKTVTYAYDVLSETSVGVQAPQDHKQTYRLSRIYQLTSGPQIRVTVDHDSSYAGQSRYTAETWTPTGWVEVTRIFGDDARGVAMSSGYGPIDAVRKSVELMARTLLNEATRIVTYNPSST